MDIPSSVWWKQVTGPSRLTSTVAYTLMNNASVMLVTHFDLTWRREMRYSIEEQLQNENLQVEYIDSKQDYNGGDIGRFLLNRFKPSLSAGYREHVESLEQFLKLKHNQSN